MRTGSLSRPVLPELNDLLAVRGVAGRGIDWRAVRLLSGKGSGVHTVSLPAAVGRGLQFAESRPYQRGDDVRSIDWKVTARHGRPHTKVFENERERPLWIVVDQGPSMQFGSRAMFKSVLAARAAAWLAWSGSIGGDRVGGVAFGESGARVLPPRAGDRGVLALLDALCHQAMASAPKSAPADLSGALSMLQPGVRTGDRVCVASDFYLLDTPAEARQLESLLGALAARCEVLLLHVSDPLEAAPPPAGLYPLARSGGLGWLDLAAPATRQAWRSAYAVRVESLSAMARRNAWPIVSLATDGDLLPALSSLRSGR